MDVLEDDHRAVTRNGQQQVGSGGHEPIATERLIERFDLGGRLHLGTDHIGDQRKPWEDAWCDTFDESRHQRTRGPPIVPRTDARERADEPAERKVR